MNIYSLRSVLAKVNEYQVNAIMCHFYSPQIYAWSLVASLLVVRLRKLKKFADTLILNKKVITFCKIQIKKKHKFLTFVLFNCEIVKE